MKEYIIIGDTEKYKDCLVYTCGTKREVAERRLAEILANPTADDTLSRHSNFRIKEVEEKDQWWNDPFLAN